MRARLRHGVRGNGLSRTGRGMASSHGLLAFRHLRLTGLRQRRDAAGAGALIVVLFRQRNIRHIGHDALYLAGCTGRPGFAGTARNTRRTSSVCRYVHAVAGACLRRASSGPTRLGGGRERCRQRCIHRHRLLNRGLFRSGCRHRRLRLPVLAQGAHKLTDLRLQGGQGLRRLGGIRFEQFRFGDDRLIGRGRISGQLSQERLLRETLLVDEPGLGAGCQSRLGNRQFRQLRRGNQPIRQFHDLVIARVTQRHHADRGAATDRRQYDVTIRQVAEWLPRAQQRAQLGQRCHRHDDFPIFGVQSQSTLADHAEFRGNVGGQHIQVERRVRA